MAGGVGSPHQEASYDKSKRGGFEPGKEEPGGVGGAEVIWGGGVEGDELGGQVMPRRGPYFFQEDLNQHLLCKFYFHFLK